jgi:hypothetical protein
MPEYVVVEALGPDHRRTFRVQLRIGGRVVSTGEGSTIKVAQQEAARAELCSSKAPPEASPSLHDDAEPGQTLADENSDVNKDQRIASVIEERADESSSSV